MRYKKMFLFFAMLGAAAGISQPAAAQRNPIPPEASVQLTARPIGAPQTIYIADLARLSPGRTPNAGGSLNPELFELLISYRRDFTDLLRLDVKFYRNGTLLTEGRTRPFRLPDTDSTTTSASLGALRLTNNSLSRPPYQLDGFELNRAQFEELVRGTAQSGGGETSLPTTLPSGNYSFEFSLFDTKNQRVIATSIVTVAVTGRVGFVVLVGPGVDAAMPPEEILTPTPVFNWQGNAQNYRLTIWEVLPAQRSFNEVINNRPHFDRRGITGNSFQYPASSERTFIPGKTYYWRVESDVISLGGTVSKVQSVPFAFVMNQKLAPPTAQDAAQRNVRLVKLKELLRTKFGIEPEWMSEADFVSFTGANGNINTLSSTDLGQLIMALETAATPQR